MKVTVGEVGRHLGSAVAAVRLAECGLLGKVTFRGVRRYVDPFPAEELRARPEIDRDAPAALVVRMGTPRIHPEGWRDRHGWHQDWPEQARRDAVRGDWVIDPAPVLEVGRLVALVAGYVVAAYAVEGVETRYLDPDVGRRRARFVLREDPETAAPYLGHHWTLGRGWTAAIIDPGSAARTGS